MTIDLIHTLAVRAPVNTRVRRTANYVWRAPEFLLQHLFDILLYGFSKCLIVLNTYRMGYLIAVAGINGGKLVFIYCLECAAIGETEST